MRSSIILGSMYIGDKVSTRPLLEDERVLIFLAVFFIVAIVMDIIDFFRSKK